MQNEEQILSKTKSWIDTFIIGENICPFAKHIPKEKLQLILDSSDTMLGVLEQMSKTWTTLKANRGIETSIIIYPSASQDFEEFLDWYYACDQLLEDMDLRSDFQLVAFHPRFLFDNAEESDAANYTNRSPYPMIHILREDSVSKAVEGHPDVDSIPARNMEHLRKKDEEYWKGMMSYE